MVDMPAVSIAPSIGAMNLEGGIAGPIGALIGAFAGHDQDVLLPKPLLAAARQSG